MSAEPLREPMIFVNENHGNDHNYGTSMESPVKTLKRAEMLVQSSRKGHLICVTTLIRLEGNETAEELALAAEAKGEKFELTDWLP